MDSQECGFDKAGQRTTGRGINLRPRASGCLRALLLSAAGLTLLHGTAAAQTGKPPKPLATLIVGPARPTAEPAIERIGPAAPAARREATARPTPGRARRRADATIQAMQEQLKALGHDPGPADGLNGPRTREALSALAATRGIADLATLPIAAAAEQVQKIAAGAASGPLPSDRATGDTIVAAMPAVAAAPAAEAPIVTAMPVLPIPAAAAKPAAPPAAAPQVIASAPAADHETAATEQTAAPLRSPAPGTLGLDLATFAELPFLAESHRAVTALAERPQEVAPILERMVGVLLAHDRIDEAAALAADLDRRGPPGGQLPALQLVLGALQEGRWPAAATSAWGDPEEAAFWASVAALERGDLAVAVELTEHAPRLEALPGQLRQAIALKAVARFTEGGRFTAAHDAMRLVESWTAEPLIMGELAYWRGREQQLQGEGEAALALFESLADRTDETGVRARFRIASLAVPTADQQAAEELAAELEGLRLQWPEPTLDPAHEHLLAAAYRRSGQAVAALQQLARRGAPVGDVGTRADLLLLFMGLVDRQVPASEPVRLSLLALAGRWLPADADGRLLLASAADQLAVAGLADRADAMLAQAAAAAPGPEAEELQLRRAALAVDHGRATAALTLLANLDGVLPSAGQQRGRWLALTARALIQTGEPGRAVQLIDARGGPPSTDELRAVRLAAAVAQRDWLWVAGELRRALPAPSTEAARDLAPSTIDALLGLAAALRQAGRQDELTELDRQWGTAMAGQPTATLFEALIHPEPGSTADLQAVTELLLQAANST